MGVDGLISTPRITEPLPCTLQNTLFSHSFLILPKCPTPILGRDLLSKSEASIAIPSPPSDLAWLPLLNPTFSSPAPLPSSSLNPMVWDTDNSSVASHHAPIHICLKDPSKSPNQPQYPISQKHQQGLKPIVTKLLGQGLLLPTHSPYNTPILPVKKSNGSCHLVQDLRLINAAAIPIHPVVPDPCILLSLIPSSTTYFTVLDLKDAFLLFLYTQTLKTSLPLPGLIQTITAPNS